MLGGGNHTTNLPICAQQPWLIEYVRGDESNQKTAESQSQGKSAAEEKMCNGERFCVFVSAMLGLCEWGRYSCHFIQSISSKRSIDK